MAEKAVDFAASTIAEARVGVSSPAGGDGEAGLAAPGATFGFSGDIGDIVRALGIGVGVDFKNSQ
jgi:hypothetical protein